MANAACVGGSFLGVEKGKPATVSNLGAPAVLLLVLACLPLVLPSSDPKQGMSFGDLDGGGSAAGLQYPYGAFASSPVLSLTVVDARRRRGGGGNAKDASEAENEGQSMMSGHLDVVLSGGGDGEDGEAANQRKPKRKKPYNRHTPRQIEQLEAMFKEFHHPDEKQRAQLSRQLGLDPRQVKFWFQNRRTHLKNQLERQENARLKHENDKLRVENLSIREAIRDLVCSCCGGPAVLGELSPEEHQLRLENARLRDELARVCTVTSKFIGKPMSHMELLLAKEPHPMTGSSLELAVAVGVGSSVPSSKMPVSTISELAGSTSSSTGTVTTPMVTASLPMVSIDKSKFAQLAVSAMNELVKMARMNEPLWIPTIPSPGSPIMETLNFKEYLKAFSPCVGVKPTGFVSEASRESGIVTIDSSAALMEVFMDERRWSDIFYCIVAKASIVEEILPGVAGSRNGALLLMQAELQMLSPLVPIREVTFLRFCKQLAEGAWAVVDVSIDGLQTDQCLATNTKCRRLPSGCVLQDTPNGCKVTWVEHAEYPEASVHQLYQPLMRSGLALGAGRWLATLQRQCECLAILMSSLAAPEHDSAAVSLEGKWSLLKLARRMMENFCAGMGASSSREWSMLDGFTGSTGKDVRVMVQNSVDEPGVPPGVVLSVATAVWLPVTPERLFNFLRDEELRAEWDILSNGGPMQQVLRISKGQLDGNSVALLRADHTDSHLNSILILQETCTDRSGAMVVYTPVDFPAMQLVLGGGDSKNVALLPSGFVILPAGSTASGLGHKARGSLLTVAFQILVNSQPTAKLTVESVDTVYSLISCTIEKIKAALHCDVC
ncbi:outer cell layer 2 [Zea mays]|uniref:Outer cell layer2 n=3 Tax=Zea mays TaxID=4577 RepID=A0A1D6JC47_MAIZE|nr:outer cell layer 2 [Zea mays]AQK45452.1 Outer cell layer2 [Zea mays]|eukprot:NP_001336434.1 outer cell layer 2 [Zea mays]